MLMAAMMMGACAEQAGPAEAVGDQALTKEDSPPVERDYDVPTIDMDNYVVVMDSVVQQFTASLGSTFSRETDPNVYSYCHWIFGGAFYSCTFFGFNGWQGKCSWSPSTNIVACSAWQS